MSVITITRNSTQPVITVTSLPAHNITITRVAPRSVVVRRAGVQGPGSTIAVGTVTTLEPGDPATVANSGTPSDAIFDFGLPAGAAATIAVGAVTTVDPTDPATVSNAGTAAAAVFDFEIPRGAPGLVTSVEAGTGIDVDSADPASPEVSLDAATQASLLLADSAVQPATLTAHTSDTTNPHEVTKAQVGLSEADNTSDADKPVSTAQQTALDLKADLASPDLTGTPTAPTATPGTNTTQIATTAFVRAEAAALVDSAPSTLDTLNELAAALGDDPNFATTVTNALANKQPLAAVLTATTASFTTADETKLDGIEALADVTDATNVAAAGAVMDLQAPSGDDLNNAVDDGFYRVSSSTANTPAGTGPSGSACIVVSYNSTAIKQVFIAHTGKFMYVRRMVSSVWSSWSQILEAGDIGSVVQGYDAQLAAFAANTGITGTITVSTSDPSGGSNGDIWLKYTA